MRLIIGMFLALVLSIIMAVIGFRMVNRFAARVEATHPVPRELSGRSG